MRVLARHFTFEVGIVKDHKLVQTGPYCLIRHPGYTGAILSAFGLVGFLGLRPPGLAWALVFVLPMTALMVARIPNEEQTLHQHFGRQWEEHCKRTWRLLPPIF
ncbi:g10723 [Coccomyxa viridis]|uniref:Protein-S-isoprenylcysteine O-methyltransferase n=1 Tax=Coccomyxa viridis TaxID=1274662 RepID=A0ABP1GD51_9CHLO